MAAGALAAVIVFGATLLLLAHAGRTSASLLARSVLFGYSISVGGAFIGAMWAYVYGYLLGAGFGFAYNLAASPSAPPVMAGEGGSGEGGSAAGDEPSPQSRESAGTGSVETGT